MSDNVSGSGPVRPGGGPVGSGGGFSGSGSGPGQDGRPPEGEATSESGATIHTDHPFLPPPHERDPVRRLRGRLVAPVTLWTAGGETGATARVRPAGLPVSAVVVADGDPGLVLGLVDPDSDLWAAVEATGRFVVSVLRWEHRPLADAFAGLRPAPGGAFRMTEWRDTPWGPLPAGVQTWAGCRVRDARPLGWALAVEGVLDHIVLGEEADPLLHRRGRYFTVPRP